MMDAVWRKMDEVFAELDKAFSRVFKRSGAEVKFQGVSVAVEDGDIKITGTFKRLWVNGRLVRFRE